MVSRKIRTRKSGSRRSRPYSQNNPYLNNSWCLHCYIKKIWKKMNKEKQD